MVACVIGRVEWVFVVVFWAQLSDSRVSNDALVGLADAERGVTRCGWRLTASPEVG